MKIIIRPIEKSDSKELADMRRLPGIMENLYDYPSRRITVQDDFFDSLEDNLHVFVAEAHFDDGRTAIVGSAGLFVSIRPRMSHTSTIIFMMTHPDYQGQGIGTRLMEAILDIADNWLKLVRVELSVFVDNTKAVAWYEKFGFEKECVFRKNVVRNGIYADELLMSRIVLPS